MACLKIKNYLSQLSQFYLFLFCIVVCFYGLFAVRYDRLEDLPVAIVNNDTGAKLEGEELKLGDEFVEKLKKSKDFNFQFVIVKRATKT